MPDEEPHVLLYFDVNKTVIMHDPVQGKDLANILNDLLTERAFGAVTGEGEDAQWQWNGKAALSHAPDSHGPLEVSFGAFLRAKFPTSKNPVIAKHHKKMRKVLRQDFTSPGNAGHGLAAEHALLLERLELPPLREVDEELVGRAGLDESNYFFIVPAFFRLIEWLHARGTKFNIIFRTYGDDLHRIAQEFNSFCEGKHPFFPSVAMDGSSGSVDRRVHLSTPHEEAPKFGTFYRADGYTALIMGTFEQPRKDEDMFLDASFYHQRHPRAQVIESVPAIHHFLTHEWRESQTTLAIRDFYPYWFRHCEDATAGKLLTLDEEDPRVHAIFFDDNVLAHDAHIVDARSARDGSAVPFSRTKDINLMRAEPLDVIRSDDYFIGRFQQARANVKHRGVM